jgi:hypothetical protein
MPSDPDAKTSSDSSTLEPTPSPAPRASLDDIADRMQQASIARLNQAEAKKQKTK